MATAGGKAGGRKGGNARQALNDPDLIALMRLVEAGRFAEIEPVARRILNKRPNQPLAMKALSFSLLGLARHGEAVALLDHAIRRNPQDAELHNNRGIALSQLMRWDDSLESFRRARSLTPDDSELLKNMAFALTRMHRWGEAVPLLLEAIEKHPGDYLEAITLLADCLFNSGRYDEAWTCYGELYSGDQENLYALFQLIGTGLRRIHWEGLVDRIAELRAKSDGFSRVLGRPLVSLLFPGLDSQDHRRIAEGYSATMLSSLPLPQEASVAAEVADPAGRRLRVAYLSGDFRFHPVGFIIPEVIERHDRTRFEVLGYSTMTDDGSDIRKRLAAGVDQLVDVGSLTVHHLAERIRRDRIDILVDLSGWTQHARPESLALRCAPVQVNWLGYPGTMGHAAVADYIIGDPVVTPVEDAEYYTETIAQLPFCYLPADTTWRPETAASRLAEGLPESGFVFCSLNGSQKYNPPLFDLWCRLLRETPGSVLWLSDPGAAGAEALRQEAIRRQVQAERLVFAKRVESKRDHLTRIALADLGLDPFPYNSHSTGIDTLWAGVPLLALRGSTFAGRVGASMLLAAGLDELVAETPEQYLETALGLYHDRARLDGLRQRLDRARQSSPLFDMGRFARNLEDVYLRMWENHGNGKRMPILANEDIRAGQSHKEAGA
ncbi:MAG: tetratricopeptide repeat protein [Rhodocyclales bacterium]|nr:tetratricopeptide repeat protein [Rhodocyclales bacterium]